MLFISFHSIYQVSRKEKVLGIKRISVFMVILATCLGCAKAWKPGEVKYISYREKLYADLEKFNSGKLLEILRDAKNWESHLNESGRFQRHKVKYYVVVELLNTRLMESGVYEFILTLTDAKEQESVARDAIRFLENYFEQEDFDKDLVEEFVKVYADKKTHASARKEILNVFLERRIKSPELVWHIHDVRKKLDDDYLEDVYIGFLNAG